MKQELKEILSSFFVEVVVDYSIDLPGVSMVDMTEIEVINDLVTSRTECFNAVDKKVGGANLMKWFGNLVTAHLYLVSLKNKWLSFEGLTLNENGKNAMIYILQPQLEDIPDEEREQYLRSKVASLFTKLEPVFTNIAEASGLSKQQTWGLLANSFYNHLTKWLLLGDQPKIERDVELLKSIDLSLAGLKRNPYNVTFRFVDSWWEPLEPVRIKAACCMSYLKSEGKYCYSCPKLSKDARTERAFQLKMAKENKM
ncbi:(2Fe-2S)-binding protein [Halalkalibacter akibai]|uniref:Ferric siderophore reductase C-terminal domain-containing protein n=1 Tax=Halalkalibacter akibai (strain ATCC 43226 / DSM 21942 / CIP 109018 / JCM 9157 / 1139) TaxID=1236973 RepID=W4R0B1_HALA3|nr:(2Fe-2S)-binding protein [Halalkalibacter akibai]GAE37348.1 hypothetical protein JCM9157_4622 [Halalkalibacter akibai JCM 9157]